jgi:hypothetical protein
VRLSAQAPDDVALVYEGRWSRLAGDAANVNELNLGLKSDAAESTGVRGVYATISRQ